MKWTNGDDKIWQIFQDLVPECSDYARVRRHFTVCQQVGQTCNPVAEVSRTSESAPYVSAIGASQNGDAKIADTKAASTISNDMKTYHLISSNCQTFVLKVIKSIGCDQRLCTQRESLPSHPWWSSWPLTSLHTFVAGDLPTYCLVMFARLLLPIACDWWDLTSDYVRAFTDIFMGVVSVVMALLASQDFPTDVYSVFGPHVLRNDSRVLWAAKSMYIFCLIASLHLAMPRLPSWYRQLMAREIELAMAFLDQCLASQVVQSSFRQVLFLYQHRYLKMPGP